MKQIPFNRHFYVHQPSRPQEEIDSDVDKVSAEIMKLAIGQQAVASLSQQPVGQLNQQPASQLVQIPWGHNLKIISKCKSREEALYYVQQTQTHGWSRSVLTHQIESGLWQREGKAVDELLRAEGDQATIGILLCKKKDRLVAEYALSDIQKPMGVSEYQLTQSLPENLQSKLPSIEAIEQELAGEL